MRKLFKFAILFAFSTILTAQASYFSDTVHTVRVYFDDSGFWTELYETHETEEYMMCKVVFDAVDTLDSVGIRLKGNSSFGHPGNKKPFHLKIDEYIGGREYRGNERLTFNNCFKDPTFLREKLASEIFRGLGVPCPRATWAVVYYNDTYWGFYTVVDPINKDALTRFFGENDANLYKGDPSGTFEWLGAADGPYRTRYEKSTNEDIDDWSDLVGFCNFINNTSAVDFRAGMHDWFDMFSFARMWAANTFLVNLDSYQGSGHNYYLYFDSDGIGRYIVWDINEAFGVFAMGMNGTAMRNLAIDWHSSNRPLAQRLFSDYPLFTRLVHCALHELLSTTLEYSTFSDRVTELADLVRPYVYADPNKMYSNANFETNLNDDIGGGPPPGGGLIPGLRDFIYDRGLYISSVLMPCDAVDVAGAVLINEVMASNGTTISDEEGEFDDWFELYNPADTAVDLSFWFATDDITEPRKWTLPNGTIIAPDSYLLVWADNDAEQGPLHASFKLDADREEVALFGPDFYGNTLCDSVSWTDMPRDSSWGRYPNGSATWQICLEATPGAVNAWSFVVQENSTLPGELRLSAYPNPFNSSVRIEIENGGLRDGSVEIFDITGKKIDGLILGEFCADDNKSGGSNRHSVSWRPDETLSSGIYLVKVKSSENSEIIKITYLK
jgi:hypothetical protein